MYIDEVLAPYCTEYPPEVILIGIIISFVLLFVLTAKYEKKVLPVVRDIITRSKVPSVIHDDKDAVYKFYCDTITEEDIKKTGKVRRTIEVEIKKWVSLGRY